LPPPLHGLRVLDLSHALAGPYCSLLLADAGAEIFKLEPPGLGDMGRGWGPPFTGSEASFFLGLNRGKRGLAIDLKHPDGFALTRRLAARVDVLIENFRPGAMDRLGLGYESLAAENPGLVYCSISGYGQQGPSRDEAAMDLVVQASSGLLSITGTETGELTRCGYGVSDITAGMFAVIGILTALYARHQSGLGQHIDISMFDAMISAMGSNYASFLGDRQIPGPMGTRYPTVVPYGVYHTADRPIALAAGSQKLWAAFLRALELPAHPDFATNPLRIRNRDALDALLIPLFQSKPAAAWIDALRREGVPCSLVLNFDEVVSHPQSAFRRMFPTLLHPTAGPHQVPGPPVKPAADPVTPAPLLGQHTRQVLAELLALDEPTLDRLQAANVIFQPL
jgi:crotonobetainyl-CoA:carnitine CoA-transferase CaiB-like acyl-CoA transferase